MSERYSKLFALPEDLYCVGAPVVIAAGALQKDNQTGKVFAQLKIRNIQDKTIKAATVQVTSFDAAGRPLGNAADHQYLDLSAGRGFDFGQKTPVILPDAGTRAFSAAVVEVVYSDNSVWTASGEAWEALSAPVSLEKAFSDSELVKQYRVKYGEGCKYMFGREKDLWRCACGTINHDGEESCHRCGREAAALAALDLDELKADRDKRLAAEEEKAAEERAAAAIRARTVKKRAVIAAPIVIVAIVAIALIFNFVKARQEEAARLDAYNAAVALMEARQYDDAMAAFAELGAYKDSVEQANQNVAYEKALYLLDCAQRGDRAGLSVSTQTRPKVQTEQGQAEVDAPAATAATAELPDTVPVRCAQKAITILSALGDYKDSGAVREKAEAVLQAEIEAKKEADYTQALEYLKKGDSYSAYYAFEDLGDYKDSADKKDEAYMQNQLDHLRDGWSEGYFKKHREDYALLSEEEIVGIIATDWVVSGRYSCAEVTLNSDGSGESTDITKPYWAVGENKFYYDKFAPSVFERAKLTTEYNACEFRKIDEGLYITFDRANDPKYIFAKATSEWAKRLLLAAERR